jgi:hypothetical protein
MIGEAVCEGTVIASTRSSTVRVARTFSCGVLRIDGVFRRMLMPSEARLLGRQNERGSVDALAMRDNMRASPESVRLVRVVQEPTRLSVYVACATCGEVRSLLERHGGQIRALYSFVDRVQSGLLCQRRYSPPNQVIFILRFIPIYL